MFSTGFGNTADSRPLGVPELHDYIIWYTTALQNQLGTQRFEIFIRA